MTSESATPLDPFETALLAELKSMVAESAATEPGQVSDLADRPPRRRRGAWYVTITAVAAGALAAVLAWPGLWPTPAYAVSGGNDQEISVRVMRLEGAGGLERELRDHGINADITYLPEGKKCAPGRYTAVPTPGLTLGVSADFFEVTIPPGAVGKDETFVLTAAVVPLPDGVRAMVDFDVARGAIAPCQVVDGP